MGYLLETAADGAADAGRLLGLLGLAEALTRGGACKRALTKKRLLGLLDAAAALIVADRVETLTEGVALARESLDSGAAGRKVTDLARITQGG